MNQDHRLKERKELIKLAQEAADRGDAMAMFELLCQSTVFEALSSRFTEKYQDIPKEEINVVIGDALDEVYAKVNEGKPVRAVHSYLWKIIDNMLSKYYNERILCKGPSVEKLGTHDKPALGPLTHKEAAKLRETALKIAEGLLPRLGQLNVQNVMKYILESIRNGAQHIDPAEISDALHLTVENVRMSIKRGFERLARIAKEENLIDPADTALFNVDEYYIIDGEERQEETENIY